MKSCERVVAETGVGLEGDNHARKGSSRQVLLMDMETLNQLHLSPGAVRENISLEGVPIYSLAPGQRLRLGESVVLGITEPCEPCSLMDKIRPGLRQELIGRRGVLSRVLTGGSVSVGDTAMVIKGL